MKKRVTEEQIIGFLRGAEVGLPIKELCRRHGFSEAFLPQVLQVWLDEHVGCQAPEGAGKRKFPAEENARRVDAGD